MFEQIKTIKKSNPDNLMARYFSEEYFLSLDENKQERFIKIINSGIENPDSQMGAYAMAANDYADFAEFFDLLIRNYHQIPNEKKIEQSHDWEFSNSVCNLSEIDERLIDVSMRVRVARNIKDFPLPGAMNKQQRLDFEKLVIKAFVKLAEHAGFDGQYLSISPNSPFEISAKEFQRRVNSHQMFKDMSNDAYLNSAGISNDWSYGRGMYINKAEDFIVWVGEEDHLRIMCMKKGGNLNEIFEKLYVAVELLEEYLPKFATLPKYGNLASCPSNIGASMRASLHMKLPNLTKNGTDLSLIKSKAKELGLAVRGVLGEHSDADASGTVDISPSARLGVSEKQIMENLYEGAKALWLLEKTQ